MHEPVKDFIAITDTKEFYLYNARRIRKIRGESKKKTLLLIINE